MARTIQRVRLFFTSADTIFDSNGAHVSYDVEDGDLSKRGSWIVSGLDLTGVSGLWNSIVSQIETDEGI